MQESDAVKHSRIVKAFFELGEKIGRSPTPVELCEETGLSFGEYNRLSAQLTAENEALLGRLLTGSVIGGLSQKAAQGEVKAVEMFFRYVWGKTKATRDEPLPTLKFPDESFV